MCIIASPASSYEVDTAKVRIPQKPEKSFGQKVLEVPQTIILLPVNIVKGVAEFTVNDVVFSRPARRLIASLTRVDRIWGMYPVVGYSANKGFKGGLAFTSKKVFTKGERFKMKASYSTHDYQRYYIRYSAPNKLGAFKRVTIMAQYRYRPWESFYGLGNDSRNDDEVAFTVEESSFGLGWFHQLHPTTQLRFDGSYRVIDIYDGKNPDVEGDLGKIQDRFEFSATNMQAARLWSFGASLVHDWRNHPGQPSSGGYESLSISFNRGVGRSDDLVYLVARVDLRHFLNIYKKRMLALRLLVETIDPIGNSVDAPFYLRSSLGGNDDLRGHQTRRFVDNNLALVSVEYRYPILDHIDAFVFLDEGRVFPSITDDFSFRDWRYSAGAGLRVYNVNGLVFSTLTAFGDEGARFYFQLSENL